MSENQGPCPKCGADRVRPVAYGYPAPGTLSEWERNDIVIGGCVIDNFSSPYQCRECGAGVWPHRMFHEGHVFNVELQAEPVRVTAKVFGEALWVEGADGSLLFVPAHDYETLVLGLLVEVADDGERFAGWLRYRGLGFEGEAVGRPVRFTLDHDAIGFVDRTGSVLTVDDGIDRLVLHLLRTFVVDRGVGLDGLTTWFDDLGIRYASLDA